MWVAWQLGDRGHKWLLGVLRFLLKDSPRMLNVVLLKKNGRLCLVASEQNGFSGIEDHQVLPTSFKNYRNIRSWEIYSVSILLVIPIERVV